MTARMLEQGVDHCWLDATGLEDFDERFPTIAASVRAIGLDPSHDWLPIAPAAHYLSGGVVTDLDGASALPGLWAAGEVACTGVHGANRLASNSLLEGMVFAPRAVDAILRGKDAAEPTGAMRTVLDDTSSLSLRSMPSESKRNESGDVAKLRDELQRAMTTNAGVLRSAESLADVVVALPQFALERPAAPDAYELDNLVTVGCALVAAATAREESRGAHTRTDYPETSPDFQRRLVIR
jgi:L-aspartate oxidase